MAVNAQNFEWIQLATDQKQDCVAYIYEDIIHPMDNNGNFRVWIKLEYGQNATNIRAGFPNATYSLDLYEFRPNLSEYRVMENFFYNKHKELIGRVPYEARWEYVVPGSLMDIMARWIKKNN